MLSRGIIRAISISSQKGTKKTNVSKARLKKDYGLVGDAHAGCSNRQISLLAIESIDKIRHKGLDVKPGDFAENITTEGINLNKLSLGEKLRIGKGIILEVSQIGKRCHTRCEIFYKAGNCIMPKEGIFARVLRGGFIKEGDAIYVQSRDSNHKRQVCRRKADG